MNPLWLKMRALISGVQWQSKSFFWNEPILFHLVAFWILKFESKPSLASDIIEFTLFYYWLFVEMLPALFTISNFRACLLLCFFIVYENLHMFHIQRIHFIWVYLGFWSRYPWPDSRTMWGKVWPLDEERILIEPHSIFSTIWGT